MRFHLGAPPCSPSFRADPPWKLVWEPAPWLFQLLALPIGLFAAVLITAFWCVWTPLRMAAPTITVVEVLLSFAGVAVIHELIHVAAQPLAGRSSNSTLGFWPSRLIVYAHYDGELTVIRLLATLLMPILIISILPLLVATVTQFKSAWLAFFSAINVFMGCGDMLAACIVLRQVPFEATVRNQGGKIYWRDSETNDK